MNYKDLKQSYKSGRDNLGRDLIKPCLESATLYRRGTGYFSSSALLTYAESLESILNGNLRVEIICSPVITDQILLNELQRQLIPEYKVEVLQKEFEKVIADACSLKDGKSKYPSGDLLAYLLASEKLTLKIAVPLNTLDPQFDSSVDSSIYHVKNGYFIFPNGDKVAFDGSFNETLNGHSKNFERTQVFRGWIEADQERLNDIIEDVDADWNNQTPQISVRAVSKETIELIKKSAPKFWKKRFKEIEDQPLQKLWPHQEEAVQNFLSTGCGILEMATGTGKTTTSLEILKRLIIGDKIDTIIVTTFGTDLLSQWCDNILLWASKNKQSIDRLTVFRKFDSHNDIQSFLGYSRKKVIVVSNNVKNLNSILNSGRINFSRTLIIHDEIHRFGSASKINGITENHKRIAYRLGLSATPDREYDDGTEFLKDQVGPIVYKFPVEKAIEAGVLCEFDYNVINFELTQDDRDAKKAVFARAAHAKEQGTPWTEEQLFIELSRVVKKAVMKPLLLDDFLSKNPATIKSSIFFVADSEQGDLIGKVIRKYTNRYRAYYHGTESSYLDMLSNNQIDCLIACQRLNEGIDIKGLKSVFLISSDNAKLNTVQRIGRCLRTDPKNPDKRAFVLDFILSTQSDDESESADSRREAWLREISTHRRRNGV